MLGLELKRVFRVFSLIEDETVEDKDLQKL